MQIIPVIDLKNNQVVRAVKGDRSNYQPIKSGLCPSSNPIDVVTKLLEKTKANIFYIADLDSIENNGNHLELIFDLSKKFTETIFWIDAGFKSLDQINLWNKIKNFRPVIGTESHTEINTLLPLIKDNSILSLDFKNDQFFGPEEILNNSEAWPHDVIIMALDSVGSDSGPDMKLYDQIKSISPDKNYFAAGGVRNKSDLALLEKNNLAGILISSALHNNKI